MHPQRYLLKFYYIGKKKYHGSQRQHRVLTIEDCIIKALKEKCYINTIESSGFEVASRTDKLVSARGAVFSVTTEKRPILMEINTALPREIGIWAHATVPTNFLSRFNALQRHYKYIMPIIGLKKYKNIDFKLMQKACDILIGTHNFSNFAKKDNSVSLNKRTIDSIKMRITSDFLIFDFKSRAFLRQQIRRMLKKILELGVGDITYSDFLELFDSSKSISYQPLRPDGLILWDIIYPENIKFKVDKKSKERMLSFFSEQEEKFVLKNFLFKLLRSHNNY
ncbi:MAG: tRNA pseudouridine(38-40) synthase TruA [Promethearchaeota archaeon]|nr:MAG: tRNA pseudouridine(38-40) synthase TruA [Candidatus Lokiarchaeota archaeon]